METNLPGIYAAGDIVTFDGKLPILSRARSLLSFRRAAPQRPVVGHQIARQVNDRLLEGPQILDPASFDRRETLFEGVERFSDIFERVIGSGVLKADVNQNISA